MLLHFFPGPCASACPSICLHRTNTEKISRHVLSNVGRVASRDSSRTFANIQDVFVALCEDETVYNLFKSMDGKLPILLSITCSK